MGTLEGEATNFWKDKKEKTKLDFKLKKDIGGKGRGAQRGQQGTPRADKCTKGSKHTRKKGELRKKGKKETNKKWTVKGGIYIRDRGGDRKKRCYALYTAGRRQKGRGSCEKGGRKGTETW